jgi:thiol-disulfide isomerase/thioredoxin
VLLKQPNHLGGGDNTPHINLPMIIFHQLIFTCCLTLLSTQVGVSQKVFRIEIFCYDSAITKNLSVEYDNGKTTKACASSFLKGHLTISDSFYALKAMITISKIDNNQKYSNSYFISEKPAKFTYKSFDSSNNKLVLENFNAIDLGAAGENSLKQYTSKEESDVSEFFMKNGSKVGRNDSAAVVESNVKISAIIKKRLKFVEKNNSSYYSFYYFRKNLIGNLILSPDSLLNIYNNTFPSVYRNSFEGDEIVKFLKGRLLSSIKHSISPDFSTLDINGKKIDLKKFKGKYVLLSFWATWCSPCVAELPAIREIRKSTSDKKLEIISISYDTDKELFRKGIKNYEMNWVNIFYDEDISKKYGVSSLPMLFLIDDTGRVVYSRKTDETEYTKLAVLRKIINNANLK